MKNFAETINEQPEARLFRPHEYQKEAINWIIRHPVSGLFLSPGLGKTSSVLMAFRLLKHENHINKMLVVAPLRVAHFVWPAEIKKWSQFNNMSIGVLHGKDKNKVFEEDHDIYVVNPDGLQWLSSRVAKSKWDLSKKWMLAIDESSNFKNSRSQRFKTLKALAKTVKRKTILTGSPAPNGLINLWSQIFLLDSGDRLGKFVTAFRNNYFYPSGFMGYAYKIQPGGEKRIYSVIEDIVMHKGNEELDLPEKLNNTIEVHLPPSVQKLYNDMKRDFVIQLNEEDNVAVNAAVLSGKLKQIANGGLYNAEHEVIPLHEAKTEVVQSIASELDGRPLLVMYEYLHDLARLQAVFPSAPRLGGGIAIDEANRVVNKWNLGETPVLLLHPASAGHGLNLQGGGCHDVAWYSITFDLELYEQANARVHRQGVKNQVTIHHLVAQGTIDERVMKALKSKTKVQTALLYYLSK